VLKVLVHNDDVTSMEFVAMVLESVFGKSRDEALKIVLDAHHNGRAICGVFAEARARDLASQAMVLAQRAGQPLQFSVADADSSD
jgi:ATP-dependent Clp protease adaptor protein ClpS